MNRRKLLFMALGTLIVVGASCYYGTPSQGRPKSPL